MLFSLVYSRAEIAAAEKRGQSPFLAYTEFYEERTGG
jgi:hypothetical protein